MSRSSSVERALISPATFLIPDTGALTAVEAADRAACTAARSSGRIGGNCAEPTFAPSAESRSAPAVALLAADSTPNTSKQIKPISRTSQQVSSALGQLAGGRCGPACDLGSLCGLQRTGLPSSDGCGRTYGVGAGICLFGEAAQL